MTLQDPLIRLDELAAPFERELEAFIGRVARGGVPNLHDALAYALGLDSDDPAQRGKRIRPALCLLAAEALEGSIELAMPFALAVELMHNFFLVHDDIEDGDAMRRGRPSVWKRHGLAHGVNIGDYLLIQAQAALTGEASDALEPALRLRLLGLFTQTLDRTHVGQALDINARADRDITTERYMHLTRQKTGFYLAAPIQGGALTAGAGEATVAAIGVMAQFLGPLFQIMDDLIDLTEGKGREAPGSDIREGKRSFMVAHAAAHAAPADRERLFDILDKPRETTTDDDVAWAIELFQSGGAIEAGRRHCQELYERSLPALEALPPPLARALGPVFESLSRRRR